MHLPRLLALPSCSRLPPPSKQKTELKGRFEGNPVVRLGWGCIFWRIRANADFGEAGSTKMEHDIARYYFCL